MEEKDNNAKIIDLFRSLDRSKLNQAIMSAEFETDSVYRVLHDSNKIYYRFKDLACEQISLALSPLVGLNNDLDSILYFLELFEFDPLVIKALSSMNISEKDQLPGRFDGDSIRLMGSYLLIKEVSDSIRENLKNFSNREGFLFQEKAILTPKEALFLDAWGLLGNIIRYKNDQEFIQEFRGLF
jgi:hypothetical protein